jgi:hypothetical protein
MKFKHLAIFLAAVCILSFSSSAFAASKQSSPSPSIFVPESKYAFSTVIEGAEVTHGFIIKNKGDAVLNIEKVRTG